MSDQGPGDPGGGAAPSSGVGAPADLGIRFLARLIDSILLGIAVSILLVPFVIGAMFDDVGSMGGLYGGFGAGAIISGVVAAAIYIGYYAFMESSRGQTVGKMLLGLQTQGPDGGNPSLEMAIKRNGWYVLGIIPFIGGLAELAVVIYIAVTINNSPTHTGWHDEFAGGTRVIKIK